MITIEQLKDMTISNIASVIWADWKSTSKSGIYFGAKPYLEAMLDLQTVKDSYGLDSGVSIIAYFLSNATTYKGEQARLIKTELKRRAGIK